MNKTTMACLRLLLLTALILPLTARAGEYRAGDLQNPQLADSRDYVLDLTGTLSPTAEAQINSEIAALRNSSTSQLAVAILPSIGDEDPDTFATDLFEKWGIGQKGVDNGVLLLMVMDQHVPVIRVGYGMEGVVPDIAAHRIINDIIVPKMKQDDLDGAVTGAVGQLVTLAADPQARAEFLTRAQRQEELQQQRDSEELKNTIIGLCGFVGIATYIIMVAMIIRNRRKDRYHRALSWRSSLLIFWLGALFSAGIALPAAIIVSVLAYRARNKRRRCPRCNARMKKLPEDRDNDYLTPAQDLEEKLGTVDYDVWQCPKCNNIEVYSFPMPQTKYSRCPRCGTVARHLVDDRVLQAPTTRHAGVGEKTFHCEYCGNNDRQRYDIARENDGAAAAAALGAAALLGGRGGHSSGGFGGGFGGGSTGGGGASGHW